MKYSPINILRVLLCRYGGFIPDAPYLRIMYRLFTGKRLHLNNPQTFNEKLQWLKVYGYKDEYAQLVDKVAVKDIISKQVGSQFVIPTIGVWDKPEDIEWDKLPQSFVIKTSHGGGSDGVIVVPDSSQFKKNEATQKLRKAMTHDIYKSFRERPYKYVKKCVFAEEYIGNSEYLQDYKFFCFDGEPKFCQYKEKKDGVETIDIFDMEWNLLPFSCLNPASGHKNMPIPKPEHFDEMLCVASILAKGKPFVRIDLYNTKGVIYFGEITFYPGSGMGKFTPDSYDRIVGDMIQL